MKNIRFAVPEDAEAILEIYAPYILETVITFEYEVPSVEAFRQRMEGMMYDYPYLVWEEDGVILGYAYAHRQMERAAYDWTAELSVYLRRDVGGRGIGTALYSCLLELLTLQHLRSAYALVTSPNPPSEALHAKLGFERMAFFPALGYKMAAWRDIIWYGKLLCDERTPSPFVPFHGLDREAVEEVLARHNNR